MWSVLEREIDKEMKSCDEESCDDDGSFDSQVEGSVSEWCNIL